MCVGECVCVCAYALAEFSLPSKPLLCSRLPPPGVTQRETGATARRCLCLLRRQPPMHNNHTLPVTCSPSIFEALLLAHVLSPLSFWYRSLLSPLSFWYPSLPSRLSFWCLSSLSFLSLVSLSPLYFFLGISLTSVLFTFGIPLSFPFFLVGLPPFLSPDSITYPFPLSS